MKKWMGKRIVGVFLSGFMVSGLLLPPAVSAAEVDSPEVLVTRAAVTCSSYSELSAALSNASTDASSPTEIQISNDISVDGATANLVVKKGTYVTLESADSQTIHTIKASSDLSASFEGVLDVCGSLTLKNVVVNANYLGRVAVVENSASLTLSSGAALKNGTDISTKATDGLGIDVKGGSSSSYGTLIMEDGSAVSGCKATGKATQKQSGVGIFIGAYGQFNMTGGTISDNLDVGTGAVDSATVCGGGVCLDNYVTFNMSGGTITGNTAHYGGGGVYMYGSSNSSVMNMSGSAVISDNTASTPTVASIYAKGSGGGVYLNNGVLNISGSAVISGNSAISDKAINYYACGGGIFTDFGTVNQTGGEISGNFAIGNYTKVTGSTVYQTSFANGGGIFTEEGTVKVSGGSISGNQATSKFTEDTASGCGGGLYVGFNGAANATSVPSSCQLTGGEITGNTAQNHGSGVYLADYFGTVSNTTGTSNAPVYSSSAGTSVLKMGKSIVVSGNSGDNLYLQKENQDTYGNSGKSTVTVSDTLNGSGAEIYFTLEDSSQDSVLVAEAGGSYEFRNTDLSSFNYEGADSSEKQLQINDSNQVVLAPLEYADSEREDISGAEVYVAEATYDGLGLKPDVTVTLNGVTLIKGTDYSVSYQDNTNAGTDSAVAIVNGKGKYKGTAEKLFTIKQLSLSDASLTKEAISDMYYTGQALQPAVTIKLGDTSLVKAVQNSTDSTWTGDYTITFSDNTNAGTATAELTGIGNYTGTITETFQILKPDSEVIVSDATSLSDAIQNASGSSTEPTEIILNSDIALTSGITVPQNKYIRICGNQHTITMGSSFQATVNAPSNAMFMQLSGSETRFSNVALNGGSYARILYISSGAESVIDDDATLAKGKASTVSNAALGGHDIYNAGILTFSGTILSGGSASACYGVIQNASGGKMTITSGSLIQNATSASGGALCNMSGATAEMEGGTIKNGLGYTKYGAAVSNLGTFTMSGASIIENSNCAVSAVYNAGTFNLESGVIKNNINTYATDTSCGGALYSSGTVNMSGGTITGNSSLTGGGVFINSGTFVMDGETAAISDNTAIFTTTSSTSSFGNLGNGGGLYLNSGQFYLKQGSITENSADYVFNSTQTPIVNGNGGGIFVQSGTVTMSGGSITGNSASARNSDIEDTQGLGGGICMNGSGKSFFQMSGGTIEGNTAGVSETAGICLAKTSLGSTSGTAGTIEMSGSAKMNDTVYLPYGSAVKITGALNSDAFCNLQINNTVSGAAVAEYADLSAGESEFLNTEDVSRFHIQNQEVSLVVNKTDRAIEVAPTNLSECTVTLKQDTYAYTGAAIKPYVIVKDSSGNILTADVSYENNINKGTGKVTVDGDGTMTSGEVTLDFQITAYTLTADNVTLDNSSYIYTGSEVSPIPEVSIDDVTLSAVSSDASVGDYVLSYENNKEKGTAYLIVTGKNNCDGEVKIPFYIGEKQTFSGTASYSKTYGTDSFILGLKSTQGGDLTYESSNTAVATVNWMTGRVTLTGVGTAEITVTSANVTYKSVYYATTSKTVKITVTKGKQTISGSTAYNKTYGNAAFTLNSKAPSGGGKLSYASGDTKIVTVSSAGKVTIKGTGRTTVTVKAAASTNYLAGTKTITVTVAPHKMAISSLKNSATKQLTVSWKQDKTVTGYEVCYASSKKYAGAHYIVVKKNSVLKSTISGLKKNTTYYVRVRSYKLVNGKALFGNWSGTKSVKVKK